MAKIWTDGFNTYETEEEARDQAMTDMTWDDVEDYFRENMTFHDFFTRVHEAIPTSLRNSKWSFAKPRTSFSRETTGKRTRKRKRTSSPLL